MVAYFADWDVYGRDYTVKRLVIAAITGKTQTGGTRDAADYPSAAKSLDWVMAMTYDYYGAGDPKGPAAPQSALTPYPASRHPAPPRAGRSPG